MKKINLLFFIAINVLLIAQVGINTENPTTTLQINHKSPIAKVEGLIIPRLSGDDVFAMPILATTVNEANLVYATSAASVANQIDRGENLKSKGFYFWDDAIKKWVSIDTSTTTITNLLAFVKPMNMLLSDNDGYTFSPNNPLIAPNAPQVKLMDAGFTTGGSDFFITNNPLAGPPNNFTIWDDSNKKINVPSQLLGYAITINISLKYQATSSNSEAIRFVAFTGDAVVNLTNGNSAGGQKLKDLTFTQTKTSTSAFTTVRDELVLSPIIVTQSVIDHGIKLYLGSANNSSVEFYEPVLTIDYGVVNTTL